MKKGWLGSGRLGKLLNLKGLLFQRLGNGKKGWEVCCFAAFGCL
jgi:hypothetical protein